MKKAITICLVSIIVLGLSSGLSAQDRPTEGTFGISASIQNGQTNLQLPIWVTQDISIAPLFGINYREDTFTSLNIGVAPRFYQDLGDNFGSYVGAQALLQNTSPEVGPQDTDFLLGATGGGEYFLDEHFSIGIEGQLNFLVNDNGNNGLSTGAAVIGSFYF